MGPAASERPDLPEPRAQARQEKSVLPAHKGSGTSRKQQALKRTGGAGGPASAQAIAHKLEDRGTRLEIVFTKFIGARIKGRCQDPGVGWMFHVERNLVW